ncbi:MAG: NAD(+)/NADH kinase [Spirochaetaceae bacterium]|nr:NAD(+)/NADH kinase [Spirochaetaceae bacterium]
MRKKRAVIVINTYKEEAQLIANDVKSFLEKESCNADFLEFSGPCSKSNFDGYDLAVTLGGDGTVLFAARGCFKKKIPIFPINLGEFGFIAGIQKESWQERLSLFLRKKLPLTSRSMLSVTALRNGNKIFETYALNDVVVSADRAAKIVSLGITFNGNSFGKFQADGIIVATATGSTAYSVAAGGPIVDPELDAFVLSTICPFSLSNRPIVLPSSGVLCVDVLPSRDTGVSITADGQVLEHLETGDIVFLQKAEEKVLLADCGSSVFYSALRSKLHWSGGPSA